MRIFRQLSVCGLALAFGLLMAAQAAEGVAEKPQIGQPAPDFELKDTAGKTYQLADCKGKVVVIDFWSCQCPWAKGTEADRNANVKKYQGKDVVFLCIASNRSEPEEVVKPYLESVKAAYPLLLDTGNVVADKYSAMQTPEIFIVDKGGKLAYHGAFDNRSQPSATGDTNYIANAVDALLAGKPVEKAETKAFGCGIQRVKRS